MTVAPRTPFPSGPGRTPRHSARGEGAPPPRSSRRTGPTRAGPSGSGAPSADSAAQTSIHESSRCFAWNSAEPPFTVASHPDGRPNRTLADGTGLPSGSTTRTTSAPGDGLASARGASVSTIASPPADPDPCGAQVERSGMKSHTNRPRARRLESEPELAVPVGAGSRIPGCPGLPSSARASTSAPAAGEPSGEQDAPGDDEAAREADDRRGIAVRHGGLAGARVAVRAHAQAQRAPCIRISRVLAFPSGPVVTGSA